WLGTPRVALPVVTVVIGKGEFSPGIPRIKYEGPSTENTLAFKRHCDWMRFSVAFRHSFRGTGGDLFGAAARLWPWEDGTNSVDMAKRMDFWCFHDRDIAPDGKILEEANANLDEVVALAMELQNFNLILKGLKLHMLNPGEHMFPWTRYKHMHGSATYPELGVHAYSAAQVKKAMESPEVTHYLGGENYTLLNTNTERELNHMARFFQAVEYKKKIGFNGTLLIEPKPQEPAKNQYDWDAATTTNFLRKYDPIDLKNYLFLVYRILIYYCHPKIVIYVLKNTETSKENTNETNFKLNMECDHATLSSHSFAPLRLLTLETARINGLLGNIDANSGDPQIGWDTDQFLTDIAEATMIMHSVVRNGGIAPGGFNLDAKLESTDVEDLFIDHIVGMDTLARGLRNAAKIIEEIIFFPFLQDGSLAELVHRRYLSLDTDVGALVEVVLSHIFLLKNINQRLEA
ncbi:Xylose isomerase, partial [Bertholletia excelsa]